MNATNYHYKGHAFVKQLLYWGIAKKYLTYRHIMSLPQPTTTLSIIMIATQCQVNVIKVILVNPQDLPGASNMLFVWREVYFKD